jgi:hypothetical protein
MEEQGAPSSVQAQPAQQAGTENQIASSTEGQPGVYNCWSPILDGNKTPPCFPFPRKWNFHSAPVLAPDILKFHRVMIPKSRIYHGFDSLAMIDSEPCGNKGHFNDAANPTGLNDQKSTQKSSDPGSKQIHLNECDGLGGEPTGCSFDGPRKRSSNFISNVTESPPRFRGDRILGAFKCIKMRKHV